MLSFPFPLRFLLATHPALIGRVLGIVYRVIAGHLIRQAGFTQQSARTSAVTLIQRFGSALNLYIHFHMLILDGVYAVTSPHGNRPRFQWVREPTSAQLTQLVHTIARRVGRLLEREGLLEHPNTACPGFRRASSLRSTALSPLPALRLRLDLSTQSHSECYRINDGIH